ncbi:hypothetical protein [Methylocystis parvus]|uniref:Uncharacterized protein n=1 Tax=Methylocystis parvus TaxID=134 RepID=A0A6B8LYS2_9HYPH|nr:hypothetical protein [Methylocystis parvus]QGM96614.1 hypothetical protein F7D14_03350 [Methylocystis parvus]WBJ99530.1 hypothetical protein MMG94_16280 [Methylocystis parvus OBBP]
MSATREQRFELAVRKIVQGATELDQCLAAQRGSRDVALARTVLAAERLLREAGDELDANARLDAAQEALEQYCQNSPGPAVDFMLASLERSAGTMSEIVDETRRDLVEMEVRRKQIDRTQAQTREVLEHLLAETH